MPSGLAGVVDCSPEATIRYEALFIRDKGQALTLLCSGQRHNDAAESGAKVDNLVH